MKTFDRKKKYALDAIILIFIFSITDNQRYLRYNHGGRSRSAQIHKARKLQGKDPCRLHERW